MEWAGDVRGGQSHLIARSASTKGFCAPTASTLPPTRRRPLTTLLSGTLLEFQTRQQRSKFNTAICQ